MAWTQTDLDRVEAAIASGTLSVSFGDRSITYRSITDLLKARDAMKSAINGSTASGGTGGFRCTYGSVSKG